MGEDAKIAAVVRTEADKKGDPIPFIPLDDKREQKMREEKLAEQKALERLPEGLADMLGMKRNLLATGSAEMAAQQSAIAKVTAQENAFSRMQQMEREIVRNKTLGE